MLGILLTIIALVIWCVILKKILNQRYRKVELSLQGAHQEYESLLLGKNVLLNDVSILRKEADEIASFYETAKAICKSLDEETIITTFLKQVRQYVDLKECKLLKGKIDTAGYQEYTVHSLLVGKQVFGSLVVSPLEGRQLEIFGILLQQFSLAIKRAVLYGKVQELAITDTLTGVFTRKHYVDRLKEEFEYSNKFQYSFALLMLDVDHFKDFNDQYGHLVGDAILREVSKEMKGNLRQIDLIGRYGGEEFSIMLTQTDKEGALYAAERIRKSLESRIIRVYDEDVKVTLSIGLAMFPEDALTSAELIDKADQALYQAKEKGRNRVCSAS